MTRPFRFGVQAGGPTDPEGWMALARRAEELGYSTLSMADHFSNELAPFPGLAVAAAATSTLRVGTMVAGNDFRHPAVLAHDASTLDLLSGGRLELGIGAGWMLTDYEQTGIDHDRAGVRIERMEEAVAVIKQWFTGEPFDHDGAHYRITGLAGTRGVQTPHPPIVMGGGGPRMLRTAARCADIIGLNPSLHAGRIDANAGPTATVDATRQKIDWIRDEAGDRFSDIELQCRAHIAAITDDAAALAAALAPALGLTTEEALGSPHALAGTVDEIVDKLRGLREQFGLTYFTWGADAMNDMAPVVERLAGR